jgi:flavodoxin
MIMTSLATTLALGTATSVGAKPGDVKAAFGQTLVAYLSRSGTTRVIAGQIARALQATLFEIVPARPYPADYFETVEEMARERDSGFEPPLNAQVPELARYQTVFLGFPVWGETAPPPIRSFLSSHDLTGKTVIPFVTHGGYGVGSSLDVLRRQVKGARILDAFTMQGPQERQTVTRVMEWLPAASSQLPQRS